ncbi:hypothetical protein B0G62_10486 [Paraburkholderia eburnea]|uniref:Uncharacterized protein n=2 Tax=Paraburkholderia eburnea TaxID=1189126 RepID=A0A2S4MDT1_9BURK|nr:hypothetical protein B0G62_10486 [Paraburkholderia eburnea]PRZ23657.1 hypothetical protein BX588_10486 [Paraburkholderia eburnea]
MCGGSAAELARRIEREASYVTRMLYPPGKNGRKRIGEELVEIIETVFGKPRGWLDSPSDPDATAHASQSTTSVLDPIESEILTLMKEMSTDEKNQLLGAAKMLLSSRSLKDKRGGKSNRAA